MSLLKYMAAVLMNHMFSPHFRAATVLLIFRMLSSYCFQFCRFPISRPVVQKPRSCQLESNHRPEVLSGAKRRAGTRGVWPLEFFEDTKCGFAHRVLNILKLFQTLRL